MRRALAWLWTVRRAILFYLLLLGVGLWFGDYVIGVLMKETDLNPGTTNAVIAAVFVLFIVTAALPFVPGAEIGLALLMMLGATAAPAVYLSMIAALMLSYGVGRSVPGPALAQGLEKLRLRRAAELIRQVDEVDRSARFALILRHLPAWLGPHLLRNRYLVLALALNIPGNSIVGGGGGLAFVAGASRLYRPGPFLLTLLIAVAPIPLVFLLSGYR